MFFCLFSQLSKLAVITIMSVFSAQNINACRRMFFWLFSLALSLWALFKTTTCILMSVFFAQNTHTSPGCFSASSLCLCQSRLYSKLAAAQIVAVFSAQKYEKILTCSSASFYPGFVQNDLVEKSCLFLCSKHHNHKDMFSASSRSFNLGFAQNLHRTSSCLSVCSKPLAINECSSASSLASLNPGSVQRPKLRVHVFSLSAQNPGHTESCCSASSLSSSIWASFKFLSKRSMFVFLLKLCYKRHMCLLPLSSSSAASFKKYWSSSPCLSFLLKTLRAPIMFFCLFSRPSKLNLYSKKPIAPQLWLSAQIFKMHGMFFCLFSALKSGLCSKSGHRDQCLSLCAKPTNISGFSAQKLWKENDVSVSLLGSQTRALLKIYVVVFDGCLFAQNWHICVVSLLKMQSTYSGCLSASALQLYQN
jgi:hypothetical protein